VSVVTGCVDIHQRTYTIIPMDVVRQQSSPQLGASFMQNEKVYITRDNDAATNHCSDPNSVPRTVQLASGGTT
jgi:hypothetical protein